MKALRTTRNLVAWNWFSHVSQGFITIPLGEIFFEYRSNRYDRRIMMVEYEGKEIGISIDYIELWNGY